MNESFIVAKLDIFDSIDEISISKRESTMVENGKKHRQNCYLIIHFPTSEGVSEVSERANE